MLGPPALWWQPRPGLQVPDRGGSAKPLGFRDWGARTGAHWGPTLASVRRQSDLRALGVALSLHCVRTHGDHHLGPSQQPVLLGVCPCPALGWRTSGHLPTTPGTVPAGGWTGPDRLRGPRVSLAGEAEVHPPTVPRDDGRQPGGPGPRRGDLRGHHRPAAQQCRPLRPADPGARGQLEARPQHSLCLSTWHRLLGYSAACRHCTPLPKLVSLRGLPPVWCL